MNFERIKRMFVKEFIHIFRDPKMRGVIFLAPIIQLLIFGYAVTTDVRNVATAVFDLDNSVASRELVDRFEKSGYFTVVTHIQTEAQAQELLDRGKVLAVLRLNKGLRSPCGLAARPGSRCSWMAPIPIPRASFLIIVRALPMSIHKPF
jgi:hypothetical protein